MLKRMLTQLLFVAALMITVAGIGLAIIALSQRGHSQWMPPQTPQINAQQNADGGLEPKENTAEEQSSSEKPVAGHQENAADGSKNKTQNQAAKGNEGAAEFYVFWGFKFRVSDLALIGSQFLLFLATVGIVIATWCLVTGADNNAKKELRAYVSVQSFNTIALVDTNQKVLFWRIGALWANPGSTPAMSAFNHISWKLFPKGQKPDDIGFPDLWAQGQPQEIARMPLGAKNTLIGETVDIPIDQILAGNREGNRIYIWGWAEYNDVFGGTSERHRTEFCIYLRWPGDPTVPNANHMDLRFHSAFNGFDPETYRQPAQN